MQAVLPTPAFPRKQSFRGRTQSLSLSQAQTQSPQPPPLPQAQWSQFDFKLSVDPAESSTSTHSISSSISSSFSRTSSEMGTSSWSPTTTHQSKSSDGDQFFHAQTADLTVMPSMSKKSLTASPPARYAFAKTATARKMSLNYHQINPRISSISTLAAEQLGDPPPVLARPTVINVPRPRTSSGIPGSPRVIRNSNVPPGSDEKLRSRAGSHQGNIYSSAEGSGGSGVEEQNLRVNSTGGSPLSTPPKVNYTLQPSPLKCTSPESTTSEKRGHYIRSSTSTPLLTSSRVSTPFQNKELTRRRTDMDSPAHGKKFSLFPCQGVTPVFIKDTPALYSPASVNSWSMSVSSMGRPVTAAGGANSKPSTESWSRPLPPLPPTDPHTNGKPGKSKKSGKEKGEKTTLKSLKKQVVASFQNFSGSLRLKKSLKDKAGFKKAAHALDEMPAGIGVAA